MAIVVMYDTLFPNALLLLPSNIEVNFSIVFFVFLCHFPITGLAILSKTDATGFAPKTHQPAI